MSTATATANETAWGPIGQEVYERTYSRPKADGTSESWPETVVRVVDGNLALAPGHIEDGEREALIEAMTSFDILPAGRHLWASGAETTLGLFNCHRAGWDDSLSGHFLFTFDQLMLGGGVGANYSQDYLDRVPAVENLVSLDIRIDGTHPDYEECKTSEHRARLLGRTDYVIEDSREGWTKALELVIEAHRLGRSSWLILDASLVRPRGSLIHGFGGIASGPGPLVFMLNRVNEVLNGLVGRHLDPLGAMVIDHEIAACVISGNVRRSARMSILHWKDPAVFRFIQCKHDPSLHWTTNISVEVDASFFLALDRGDPHANLVLRSVAAGMVENGEPGFYNSALASEGEQGDVRSTNPCGEIALEEWEQCCLGHVNLSAFVGRPVAASHAFRLMARYLVRATLGKSSDARQEAIKEKNRRIGVGFFGFHDWALLHGVAFEDIPRSVELRSHLSFFGQTVQEEAEDYAKDLGINAPVKATTVAPTGSIAKLPGVSEGIQPPFSPYFLRRVRYATNDPRLTALQAEGYHVEPCLYSEGTSVVSFPCRDEILDKVSDPALVKGATDIKAESYLQVQALVQSLYADNAISITVNFDRADLMVHELEELLREYLPRVKGITLMPETGRPQSPYEKLSREAYEADSHHLIGQAMDDCASGACPIR